MRTSSPIASRPLSFLAGVGLIALASSATHATPTDAPVAPTEEPTVTVPFGVDLVPYIGTSSALPRARRVVSFNLVGGLAGGLDALELGGAFNLHTGDVHGLQLAGAFNFVHGAVHGGQIAGAFNVASDELLGLQLGTINVAGDHVEGAQLGVINVTGDGVEGAQVGVINVAGGEVDGLQLGVINVAPKAKAGIGLINVYWEGWTEVDVAITETTLALAGIRHGSEGLYNVYYAGTRLDRPRDLTVGIGIGGRWLLTPELELSIDVTTFSTAIDGRFTGLHSQTSLRPQIAWRVAEALALWAGPTLNVLATDHDASDVDVPSTAVRLSDVGEDVQVYLWPGFAAGVRLF